MKLCTIGHRFHYELEKLCCIFLPFEKIVFSDEICGEDRAAVTRLTRAEERTALSASLILNGVSAAYTDELPNDTDDYEKECERLLAVQLYRCFIKLTGYTPQWGILTGVRPAKLFSRLAALQGQETAERYFAEKLFVNDRKISLCRASVAGEERIVSLSHPQSFSLYLSVPFCPSRCSYCSFVSHSIDRAKHLIPRYTELLCEELRRTAEIADRCGLRLETIYIGGGTPTTLSAEQLHQVMGTVREYFDLSALREYTVEAGRPDTATAERLDAIRENGATRISINPQTMNDSVLTAIGRKHTAACTEEAFHLARSRGFTNINMDLIAGLPSDTFDSFSASLARVTALDPEGVTVHALAMKRASTLSVTGAMPQLAAGAEASRMVEHARKTLTDAGIVPYYMYRQSKTVGNLENVGYAKAGYECLYNVYIMDETHTILACGASAVTKLREPSGDYIERIFNFKYPYEYITRFDEQLARKEGILRFYDKYPANHQSARSGGSDRVCSPGGA